MIRKAAIAAIAASTLSLLAAGAAPAQTTIYAGGSFSAAAAKRPTLPVVSVTLAREGDGVFVRFDAWLSCGRNGYHVVGHRRVELIDGIDFGFRGAKRGRLKHGFVTYEFTVGGEIEDNVVHGGFSLTGRIPGRRCRSIHGLGWQARTGVPVGAPRRPTRRTWGYVGTVPGLPIVGELPSSVFLRTVPGGRVAAMFPAFLRCDRGSRQPLYNFTPRMRVGPDGTFHHDERFSTRYASYTARFHVRFAGGFLADGARGTLRAQARLVSRRTHRTLALCDTGEQGWAAIPQSAAL